MDEEILEEIDDTIKKIKASVERFETRVKISMDSCIEN